MYGVDDANRPEADQMNPSKPDHFAFPESNDKAECPSSNLLLGTEYSVVLYGILRNRTRYRFTLS